MYVTKWKELLCIFKILCYHFLTKHKSLFIARTSPVMQHVIHNFSAVQQVSWTLKMEATRSFDASRTASHPTRNEPSARNSNTADRTWNQPTVRPANWTEQFLYHCCPSNHVSAAQSQCTCLNGCSVIKIGCMSCFTFKRWHFHWK